MNRPPPIARPARRRGFFLLDAITGFLVIGVLGLVLVSAITMNTRAHRRLRDAAAATAAAEQVLALLRDGQPAPQSLGGAAVRVRPMEAGEAPRKYRWVEVTVTREGRAATLVGLAPDGGQP